SPYTTLFRSHAPIGNDKRARQGRAQSIPGLFCSDDENRKGLRGGLRFGSHFGSHFGGSHFGSHSGSHSGSHAAIPSRTPTTKICSLSAVAIACSGSAIIVLPAVTARPASPALATSSIVRGPIEGRSKRRSCPGFGAFTS